MPYKSKAQQGLFHSKNSPVSAKVVKEFDNASRGQKGLPYHVKHPQGNEAPIQYGEHVTRVSHSFDASTYERKR